MILFFGHYPDSQSEREGSAQRLLGIDQIFRSEQRIYVRFHFPFEANCPPRKRELRPDLILYSLDKSQFEDMQLLGQLMSQARLIYIHSIYWARDLMEFFTEPLIREKLVLDAHGVVPEEEYLRGQFEFSHQLQRVEKQVLETARLVIVVTEAMGRHFKKKYPTIALEMLVLPIFSASKNSRKLLKNENTNPIPTLVYSGGTQSWQQVDAMIDLVETLKGKATFHFVSQDAEGFKIKLNKKGLLDQVSLASLPREEVEKVYSQSQFGLVLRDDSIVNQVACPTKLIEYMEHGLIPIVKYSHIGDFLDLGYKFVSLSEALLGQLPTASVRKEMIEKNSAILEDLQRMQHKAVEKLRNFNSDFRHEPSSLNELRLKNRILEIELKRLRESRIGRAAESIRSLFYKFRKFLNQSKHRLRLKKEEQ